MEITRKNLQKILKEWSPESEGATPDGMTDKECKYIDTEIDSTTRQVVAIIFDDYDEDEEIARSQPFEYKSSLSPKMARLAYNKACNDAKLKLNESATIRKGNKMKITKRQLRRIIREENARILKENAVNVYLDRNPDPYGSSSFNFEDEGGGMRVTGKMLSPQDLRRLADAIEQAMSPDYQPRGPIRLDID